MSSLFPTTEWLYKFPERVRWYPQLRFMGSKYRLLPWIWEVLREIESNTALDAWVRRLALNAAGANPSSGFQLGLWGTCTERRRRTAQDG
jgi:hypothetical protein